MNNAIKKFISESWNQGTQIDKANVILAILIGSGAHGVFYFVFKYVFGLYENFYVRMFAVVLSFLLVPVYFRKNSYPKLLLGLQWHLTLIYILPFVFTFNMLKTNFHELWLYWEIFMVFVLIMYVPNWLMFVVDLLIGVLFAILCYALDPMPALNFHGFNVTLYFLVITFSAITGIIFAYATRITAFNLQKEHHTMMMAMAGSIVHEIRNPLNAIGLAVSQLPDIVSNIKDERTKSEMAETNKVILGSLQQANDIINITLSDLSEKPIAEDQFSFLMVGRVLPNIVNQYGYRNIDEKNKVKLIIDDQSDFIVRAVIERFTFIIYNLLKNALYYISQYPSSVVTIGCEKRNINGTDWNVVYVHDTGPGITQESIEKLFGDFFTSGKGDGTGLGLAFCKRNMKTFGGDIICESELGKWTKFSLLFPVVKVDSAANGTNGYQPTASNQENLKFDQAEASSDSSDFNPKRILIADDQEVNIAIAKKYIGSIIKNILFDEVSNGKEALDLVFRNYKVGKPYDLVIMDVQMPVMDGIEAIREIRKFDNNVTIISNTSRIASKVKEDAISAGVDGYIIKPIPNNGLHKIVCKWLINNRDFHYDESELMNNLKGKNVLIADDEEVNLLMMKKVLQKYQMNIETVKDGHELVEKYQSQFLGDLNKTSQIDLVNNPLQQSSLFNKYDIILVDLNMPKLRGDDAIAKIRKMELIHDIHNKAIIIINTGDDEKSLIRRIMRKGADDYFIKGDDIKSLMQQLNFWLINSHHYKRNDSQNIVSKDLNAASKDHAKSYRDKDQIHEVMNHKDIDTNPLINNKLEKSDLIELKESFLSSVARTLKNIEIANNNKNLNQMSFEAHALKGISGNIGAQRLFVYISIINGYAKTGRDPKEFEENWLSHLEEIYRETKAEFEKL